MGDAMPAVGPDPLPTEWNYTLLSNFSQNGVPARWAHGSPQAWGHEQRAVFIGQDATSLSLSQDEQFVAVACGQGVEILATRLDPPQGLSIGTGPDDWIVCHIEWYTQEKSSQKSNRLLVCRVSPVPALPGGKRDAVVQIYSLDEESWSMVPVPGLKFPCLSRKGSNQRMVNNQGERVLLFSRPSTGSADSSSGKVVVQSLSDPSNGSILPIESRDVTWLGFSPDSSTIGIVTSDRQIHILDAESGQIKSATSQLEAQINAAAFSPDGSKMAATCSSINASVQVFSTSDGSRLLTVPFQQITRSLAWSPDGKTLAYGAQGGHLELFDLEAGRQVQTWQLEYPAVRPSPLNEPGDIQFVDDGSKQLFSTGMEGGVEVYDLRSNVKRRFEPGAENDFLQGKKRSLVAWSSRDRTAIVLDGDGYLRFWECEEAIN
ncbi:hypothetical protein PRZ48_011825 [Zasmidium cellare]|uniref:Anaphase-promoting complex subunit 4-like WD40 domain-containing protein n=1 Tax=Zasmidium cellare TaxID=395010 RepID=A0ABR0E7G4_ZASCE|nr:hypothetical protein PRZ48_011825 [Zasmidium cellare]